MLKKFLIGTFALAALAFATTTFAAYDFGTTTLRVGSRGEAVKNVQIVVGATPVDGVFGNITKAKVMAWQASHSLTADGVVGPATKAAMNAAPGTPVTGLPAGCTSTTGFSATTGQKCDGTTSTPGTDNNGPLTGGAGDIQLSSTSTDVESEVVEGQSEKVLGFKVEAVDSDVSLSNVKVSLENLKVEPVAPALDLTGSYRLTDYADTVSIYKGSTKVGEADAADFTKKTANCTIAAGEDCTGFDEHANTYYTKSIALSNAIVRDGDKDTFYAVVDAISNLDSSDIDENNWEITVSDIRFQDATGVVLTSTETEDNTFIFTDLSNSGDVKLTISKASGSPVAGNIEVSDSGSTKDVLMLEFKLKAEGSDMTFDEITFNLDETLAAGETLSDMLSELILKSGSSELGSETTFSAAADQDVTISLDDTFTIDAGSTETFRVYATINDVDNFTQGDSLKVSLVKAGIPMEDENGDVLGATEKTGSAAGTVQTFFSEGISADSFTSTSTASIDSGKTIKQTVKMKFDVTALGSDFYIPKTGLAYKVIDDETGLEVAAGVVGRNASSLSSSADEDTGYYLVSEGTTETFNVTVTLSSGTGAGFYYVQLSTLTYSTDTTLGDDLTYTFSPVGDFESDAVELDAAGI